MPLSLDVIGKTMTIPARVSLKKSSEIINAGRLPFCSCPIPGLRSTNQISPRCGTLSVNAITYGCIPFAAFLLFFFPFLMIALQFSVFVIHLSEKHDFTVLIHCLFYDIFL